MILLVKRHLQERDQQELEQKVPNICILLVLSLFHALDLLGVLLDLFIDFCHRILYYLVNVHLLLELRIEGREHAGFILGVEEVPVRFGLVRLEAVGELLKEVGLLFLVANELEGEI